MMKTPDTHSHPASHCQDAVRKTHIRRWFDGKIRKWAGRGVLGGLGSVLLALPALSQATIEELYAFQFADTIPGVRSAKVLDNGDVLLKMTDGRSLIVSAEYIKVLDSGSIMIAEAAVSDIVEFSLVAESGGAAAAGGAAAGGVSGLGAVLGGIGLAGAAAAGGGGGGDDAPQVVTPATRPTLNLAELQATALNSTFTGANAPDDTATVEVTIGSVVKTVVPNSDGSWDVTLTQAEAIGLPQGNATIAIRNLDSGGLELSSANVNVTVDTVPPALSITGFSDGAVLNSQEQSTDLTVTGTTDAENGQMVTVTVNGQAYSGTVSGGVWSVIVPASDLASLSDGATIAVTADVADRAGNPATQATNSFDTDFSAPAITLDPVAGGSIELIDVSGDLTLTGTSTAENGQGVALTLDGQNYSGTVSGGVWSITVPAADLAGLATGSPALVSVNVEDAAGNPSATVSVSVPVDLTGPSIAIAPLPIGAVLNAAETGSDLVVAGTTNNVGDGQQVTVTLDGQTYTANVSSNGWSVTVPAADLASLADNSDFNVTADVADADGLVAPQASAAFSKDATPPTLGIDTVSAGAVMNAVEQTSDLMIDGSTTAEDGQIVTVVLNSQSYSAAASGGSWTVTIPSADLSALPDGATVAVTANVADAAGNPAVQATASFDTDYTPPALAISGLSDGSVMNAAEQGTDLIVTGTSDAPNGTMVSVVIARSDGTVDISGSAAISGGTWSYTATAADLAGLQNLESYTVRASVSDAAGNGSQTSTSFTTDFTAPAITLNALPVGTVLDVVEQGSDLTVSGTTTAEDGQTVTVTLDGQSYAGSVSGGGWTATVPAGDLAALADATSFPISASVVDAAGNNATPATATLTTDFRPTLSLDAVGSNAAVALADAQSTGLVISGSSVGLSAGQSVNVTLNSMSVGSATVAVDGTWSLTASASDFATFNAGDSLGFAVQATVSGGPDPVPVSETVTAYVPAAYTLSEVGRSGSTVTFAMHAEPDRDISAGLAVTAELGYDASVASFDTGSVVGNPQLPLAVNTSVPNTVSFAGATLSFSDLNAPLLTFTMTVQDATQPIELTLTTPDGGPTRLIVGTDGNDTLTAANVDTFIRAGEGDDTITLDTAGRDVVVFEADPANNGTDIITGFTLGPSSAISDAFMFNGLDVATLRGTGVDFELLSVGDTIGTNTGVIGLTTVLADLTDNTLETAVESLAATQSGDALYVLATDGTDSVLVKASFSAPATANVETIATFDGLESLNNLNADNILHTDPTGATA